MTREQQLPFGELAWEDFERLCLRLVNLEANVEHCQLYGTRGQEQQGIDLYARQSLHSKYHVYQCKRERSFSPTKIRKAVEKFAKGSWANWAECLILCTQESLESTDRANELEKQAEILRQRGIKLLCWDERQLSLKLKGLPTLVDDFFGREWVRVFCGPEQAIQLMVRLDVRDVSDFRRRMGRFYSHVFRTQDPGLLIRDVPDAALPLEERFIVPDVYDVRHVRSHSPDFSGLPRHGEEVPRGEPAEPPTSTADAPSCRVPAVSVSIEVRQAVDEWVAANPRCVILGVPGSGKSTVLRMLAIDLLCPEPRMTAVADRWGAHLPVWVPFPAWTRMIVERGPAVSIEETIRAWLVGWSEERLWPLVERALSDDRLLLLVDGLDEWTNEDAARIALDKLQVFVHQRGVPAVITSRPHGFRRLGMEQARWAVAELADFTPRQQKSLARIWYNCRFTHLDRESPESAESNRRAEQASEELLAELSQSADFSDLAKVPLLLSMLILRKMYDGYLPTSRFKAYEQLTELLTVQHPGRRRTVAGIVPTQATPLTDTDRTQVLAFLAHRLHSISPEGSIDRGAAQSMLYSHLTSGLGLDDREARHLASEFLDIGVEAIGIIVSRSQTEIGFFHRAVQEYLAASHLATQPFTEQVDAVRTRCTDPQWREVILSLFSKTQRADEVEAFIGAMRSQADHPADRILVDDIITEVACGGFNCPNTLAQQIVQSAISTIESSTWMPQRERQLRHVLDGLRSVKVRSTIQGRFGRWFPSPYAHRDALVEVMGGWSPEPTVVDCLLRALRDEVIAVQRAASRSLTRLATSVPAAGDDVADCACRGEDPLSRAASLDALTAGWPQHGSIPGALAAARQSACPELRLAAILGLIRRGEQTDHELHELVRLGSWSWNVDRHWSPEVTNALVRGWAPSTALKSLCLYSVREHWQDRTTLDQTAATTVLLQGFPGDDDVAEYFAQHVRGSNHPFVSFDITQPWQMLAVNFSRHPAITAAVDEWLARPQHYEPTIAAAALVGRTEIAKRTLLHLLETSSVPFWASGSLLEGWGVGDEEVSAALGRMAAGDSARASLIACDLPTVIPDRGECRQRLVDLLKDPLCPRYDLILQGLLELGVGGDKEVADAGLFVLSKETDRPARSFHDIRRHLIRLCPGDARVRDLARRELDDPDGEYVAVARAYGGDAAFREAILRHCNPLSARLRESIAKNLKTAAGALDFALSTLKSYYADSDTSVKTEAAITYHTLLSSTDQVTEHIVDRLREELRYDGMVYGPRRQAAFAGLVVLGRMDVYQSTVDPFFGSQPQLAPSLYDLQSNPPLIRLLVEHWQDLKDIQPGMNIETEDWPGFWQTACVQADEFPAAREEALRAIESSPGTRPTPEELRFLARTRPGSPLLLDRSLRALGIGTETSIDLGWEAITAAEILGSQFTNDARVYDLLRKECHDPWPPFHALLVLCEGWPTSDLLEHYRGRVTIGDVRNLFTAATVIRFICVTGTAQEVWNVFGWVVSRLRPQDLSELTYAPLVRRLRADDDLLALVWGGLTAAASPSLKATLPRLLAAARGMSSELRAWCREETTRQVTDGLAEIGFDMVAGSYRPVWHSLIEIID